jgi:hypothetical protein
VTKDIITLMGKDVEVTVEYEEQDKLLFYPENPRTYSYLWKDDDHAPTQGEIQEVLTATEYVRENLVPSIKGNGGLIEPLLVKGRTVLEGNSRLAAYRILAASGDKKWQKVRVRRLPESITEAEVFALLGEFHIVGKKDWAPFEQAGYLYREHKKHSVTEEELKRRIGLSISKIRHLIAVYNFMTEIDDRTPNRWSFYDELLKTRRYDKVKEIYPEFINIIVEKIQDNEIERAVDVRDKLPLIAKVGGNTLKKFLAGSMPFDVAVADAKMRGAGNYNYKKLNEFRNWLAEGHLDDEFRRAPESEKKLLRYEVAKIERRIKLLSQAVAPKP